MKKLTLVCLVMACVFAGGADVLADGGGIIIAEVATESAESASEEFVEIYNAGQKQNLEGWKIEYMPASGSGWTTKAQLNGEIAPYDRYLAASNENLGPDSLFTSGMASSGGHVRIVDENGIEVDRVGWGTAVEALTFPVAKPEKGQSMKRQASEDGDLINTGSNIYDFMLSDTPSPQKRSVQIELCELPVEAPIPTPTIPSPTPILKTYPPILITELLIDPDKPLLDKSDEYIELYNPNNFVVDLKGYILQSGREFSYTFTLPSYQLSPSEYLAVFSSDSALVLANSGGAARLLDPNLEQVAKTDEYTAAKPGHTWMLYAGTWQWSTQTSPNLANSVPVEEAEETVLHRKVVAGTTSASGSEQPAAVATNTFAEPLNLRTTNYRVLVSMVVIALIYAVYEYRHDITSIYAKSKSYIRSWRQNWPKFKRWRNH